MTRTSEPGLALMSFFVNLEMTWEGYDEQENHSRY